jgi:hypothetical protein
VEGLVADDVGPCVSQPPVTMNAKENEEYAYNFGREISTEDKV